MYKNFFYSILLSIGIFQMPLLAQINIQTGYSYGFLNNEQINNQLSYYNTADNQHDLDQRFKKINSLHGFIIGVDMRFTEILAVFAQWSQKTKASEAFGINTLTQANLELDIINRVDVFSIGIDNHFRNISLGGSIDFNNWKILQRINNAGSREQLVQNYHWSSHIYLSINLSGSDVINFQVRPYIQIPWTVSNIDNGLQQTLEVPDGISKNEIYPLNFGISFLFNNGLKTIRGF